MARRKREQGLLLQFDKISCTGCGDMRLLARECGVCGERPKNHEIQHDLQRRERLVAEFHNSRLTPDSNVAPDLNGLNSQLDRAERSVLQALAGASRFERSAEPLISAFASLDQLLASWRNKLPRPQRNRGGIIGKALERFVEGFELFVEALRARDMFAAQDLEREGNEVFSEAKIMLSDLERLNEADEVFSEQSASESLNRIGRSARQLVGLHASLKELDLVLGNGTGWGALPEGMGLQTHSIQQVALASFDLESFTQVLKEARSAVEANGKAVVSSDEWRRQHARAAAFLGSAVISVQQSIFTDGASEFEVAHRVVEAVATLRDGVLRHSLATIISASPDEYMNRSSANGGDVIKKAAAIRPKLLLDENLTPGLRNAGAHADIDLNDAGFVVDGTNFTDVEFVDRFLAYLETTVATFVGTTLAVASLGLEFDYDQYLAPRDRDTSVAFLLGLFGLRCETVTVSDCEVTIEASGPTPDWMAFSAALSAMYPSSVSGASLRVATGSDTHTFTTSLHRFRAYTDGIELLSDRQQILCLAAVTATSLLDGGSPWTRDEWIRVADAITSMHDADDLRVWVREVRELREYGREAMQAEVEERCVQALADLRR